MPRLLGLLAQVVTTLIAPRGGAFQFSPAVIKPIVAGFVAHVGSAIWMPTMPALALFAAIGWAWAGALLLLPTAIAAGWLVLGARRYRLLTFALLAGAAVTWLAACVVNDLAHNTLSDLIRLKPSAGAFILRHAVVPAMMLTAVLILAADTLIRSRGRVARLVGAVVAVGLVTSWLIALPQHATVRRTSNSTWVSEIAHARTQCGVSGTSEVSLRTAPAGWSMQIECGRLRR